MKRNFNAALRHVLRHEGGYVNHPNDPGGATNKGITIATFRRYVNRNGTIADLKRLTTEQAGIVYKRQYWDAVRGDELPDGLDYAVFDFAVNSGPSRAIKFLQSVLRVNRDGRLGPETMEACKQADAGATAAKLCDARLAWMKRLRTWSTFGKGWSRRVASVKKHAMQMAKNAPPEPKPKPIPPPAKVVVKEVEKQVPVVPEGLDKPKAKSKSVWASWGIRIVGALQGIAAYFADLDWKVQITLIAVSCLAIFLAFYMAKERNRYRDEAKRILAEIGEGA